MNDFFPTHGRVAIVDDVYDEVKIIQRLLAEKGIPYVFYDYAETEGMTIKRIDGIRLLFLDINLVEGTTELTGGEKIVLAILAHTVANIIPPKNGPYAIILWTKDAGMKDKVFDYLNNTLSESDTTKPAFIGSIDKKAYMNEQPNLLAQELESFFVGNRMLAFLLKMENSMMKIPSSLIELMTCNSIISNISNQELETLLLRLAMTETGNCNSPQNATRVVLRLVSELVRDRYTEVVSDKSLIDELIQFWSVDFNNSDEIKKMTEGNKTEQSARINTFLNVNTYSENADNVSGKVYLHSDSTLRIKPEVLRHSTFRENTLCITWNKEEIYSSYEPIEVDITPSCNYAQGNNLLLRTLYGYIVYIGRKGEPLSTLPETNYKDRIQKQVKGSVYVTPTFVINERLCVLIINTNLMDLEDHSYCDSLKYLFRLNDDITNEIRKTAGDYISRLGINSLK